MNFNPQTSSNWRWVFTHPPHRTILHSISLPGFAGGDQQTELNSSKLCQTVGVIRANNLPWKLWVVHPENSGGQKLLHLFCFSTTSRFNGEYLLNETWHRQSARTLERTKRLLHCPKISRTLVHKGLKTGPEFLLTLTILFCPTPSHAIYAALAWRPTATLMKRHWVCLEIRFEALKDVKLEMPSRLAAWSGNT